MIKSYIKDGKKYYEVYVSDRNQNKKLIAKRKRGIKSDREAKEIEFQFKSELRILAGLKASWTWEKWHEEFLKRVRLNFKNSTLATYDGYLKKWIPKNWLTKNLELITTEDVYAMIQLSSSKLGSVSQKNILKMTRRIFHIAMEEGLIARNPAQSIIIRVSQTVQKVLTARETDLLLKEAKQTKHRFYYVWAFAVMTGMRSGEMYALKWTDIDLEAGIISVNKQWTNKDGVHELKTHDWRVVPMNQDLRQLLNEIKASNNLDEHVLPRLAEWTHGDQAKILRNFCESIGVTSVKFHDLRATFITNMLAQGVPLVKVMSIVGHKKMETTDIYLRLAGVDVKGATEALGYSTPKEVSTENVISVNFSRK
jgi:integrase